MSDHTHNHDHGHENHHDHEAHHDHSDHHHHHDHALVNGHSTIIGRASDAPTVDDKEKLKTVLSYLVKHNEEHIVDLEKWIFLAESIKRQDVAKELVEVIGLSEQNNEHILKAIAILNENGPA